MTPNDQPEGKNRKTSQGTFLREGGKLNAHANSSTTGGKLNRTMDARPTAASASATILPCDLADLSPHASALPPRWGLFHDDDDDDDDDRDDDPAARSTLMDGTKLGSLFLFEGGCFECARANYE